jgi:hypothetical protein
MYNYSLDMCTTRTLGEIRQMIRSEVGIAADADGRFELPALTISVRPVTYPPAIELVTEHLGMPPTAVVILALNLKAPERHGISARIALSVVAANVAVMADAEAVLTDEYENVALTRRSGELTLYTEHPEWAWPDVQARLPQPYELSSERITW